MLTAAVLLGLLLGMRHALEPDHLSAVTTLLGDARGARRGAVLGACWGAGHALALAAVAGALAVAGAQLPRRVGDAFELAVGVMLIALGARAIAAALRDGARGPSHAHAHHGRWHAHAGPDAHVHVGQRTFARRALVVGLVHGLAGSGALTALVAARLPTATARVLYILLFGAGATLGMAALTGLLGWPLAAVGRSARARRALAAAAGALSTIVGVAWIAAGCVSESRVACANDSQCTPLGAEFVCRRSDGVCGLPDTADGGNDGPMGCTVSSQCVNDPTKPICDPQSHVCRECMNDCGAGARPICASSGACVECVTAVDCAGKMKTCDVVSGACVPCMTNGECTSGVCIAGATPAMNTCANANTVAYVNNAVACSNAAHASTPAMPYCEINAAIAVGGQPRVVVAGSATAYLPVSITASTSDVTVTVVGPGRGAAPAASVSAAAGTAVTVMAQGKNVDATFDGLDFGGGLKCSLSTGVAALALKNSAVHGSTSAGVETAACAVTVDANIIGPSNAGGGVRVTGGTYVITNNIIANNGVGAYPGVALDAAATGTFAYNTVAKNRVTAGVGGIDCGAGAAKTIANSIVWKNDLDAASKQVGAQCTLATVVTGVGGGGGTTLDPTFVSATDFHLASGAAANLACCVDKIAVVSGPNSNHDVDASKRPKGIVNAADIGAHEVQ
jgi:hypothetical protein